MKHHGHWIPLRGGATSVISDAKIADSEAMYQVMMLARASPEANRRVYALCGQDLSWVEILRRLSVEGGEAG